LLAALALLGACSDDSSSSDTTAGSSTLPATTEATTTTTPVTTPATTTPATTTPATTTMASTTVPAAPAPAIWPAADVVFTTPEAAATDFLAPTTARTLGDSRPAISAAASSGVRLGRRRCNRRAAPALLRQLGPSNGWFVLCGERRARSPHQNRWSPYRGAVDGEGLGTGFEAIVVSAFVVGDAATEFDREVTMAGNLGEALPYTVTLDLTTASPGQLIVLLVRGGTGLETDPGDFAAVPVVIG
jgi:hypothetical protein